MVWGVVRMSSLVSFLPAHTLVGGHRGLYWEPVVLGWILAPVLLPLRPALPQRLVALLIGRRQLMALSGRC